MKIKPMIGGILMSDLYINKCKSFIDFMITQHQWSGITKTDVDTWLSNFNDLDEEEQKLVYKLLTHIIYFSENDITDALKMGVYNCLSYNSILEKQKETDFSTSSHRLKNIHIANLEKACFVPLLDRDAPHESANNICRTLVQQGIVQADKSIFIDRAPILLEKGNIENLVIVDDCVGSGDQLSCFWEDTLINVDGKMITIAQMCQKYNVKANYLTLFGYDQSIKELREKYKELNIVCVLELNNQHRVFSDESYVWNNESEMKIAFNLIDTLAKNAGINTYGYKGLDFAFIMHRTIPDWSLPIFWQENTDWNLLLRRKNSND